MVDKRLLMRCHNILFGENAKCFMKGAIKIMKNVIITNKTRIYITMTLIWIAVIFSFSLQPSDTSSQISSGFGKWLIEVFLSGFIGEVESIPIEQLEQMHFLLRKCAHFSEYFILGVLVEMSLQQNRMRRKDWLGLLICVSVASVDEIIQLFVSGRSGQVSDVLLDSVGALCGIGVLLLMGKIFRRMKQAR